MRSLWFFAYVGVVSLEKSPVFLGSIFKPLNVGNYQSSSFRWGSTRSVPFQKAYMNHIWPHWSLEVSLKLIWGYPPDIQPRSKAYDNEISFIGNHHVNIRISHSVSKAQ